MTGIWIDTDFGFDDLWSLLLLRHLGCAVSGVSLVAGNTPLAQVAFNASAAKATFGFGWPVWKGADKPLSRAQETAERILGRTGMRSRGLQLSGGDADAIPNGALDAMHTWLQSDPGKPHIVLALGPLTNIAAFLQTSPTLAHKITRLVWMGGSAGAGNHTPKAEFNAVADAEALSVVLESQIPLDVIDLTFCRTITFDDDDLPETDPLMRDLLGGYLDIALVRGRPGMAIYDPLAALALARPDCIGFSPATLSVSTALDDTYGATYFSHAPTSRIRLATAANGNLTGICINALSKDHAYAPGQ